MTRTLTSLAASAVLSGALLGCATPQAPGPQGATLSFNRTATFPICQQLGASCESSETTSAEIVAASDDGMTLVYTNSPRRDIGFVDIRDVRAPRPLGAVAMGGEPTSVAVLGDHAVVAVNTSASFTQPSGKLVVVDMASRRVLHEIALPGQPDSIARSPDGRFLAIAIENERDERLNKGALPQLPGGSLAVVDVEGTPSQWRLRNVPLNGLAGMLYPTDPEPEYVAINEDNLAVVTLQENNHIALVDLASGRVVHHFSAGAVTLTDVDLTDEPRPNEVRLSETQRDRLREPDGVAWVSRTQFVTANEGDYRGGSRGFTVFNTDGSVAHDVGNGLEHQIARVGHTNDKRSDAKGNEPENVAVAHFGGQAHLFVASERSSVVAVYDIARPARPVLRQVLPAGLSPEGLLAIPQRQLLVAASETDKRDILARGALNLYQQQVAPPAYPTLQSVDRADGTPIPWSALSGLAAAPQGHLVYAVDDGFFRGNRVFEIDTATRPATLRREIRITDPQGHIAALAAQLPDAQDPRAFDDTDLAALVNADGSVNLDPEGIAVASDGGFWIASEGNGSVDDPKRPVLSANLVLKLNAQGQVQRVLTLPPEVNAKQRRFGLEGIAESEGRLVVVFQRAWAGETQPRIGLYDLAQQTWRFVHYPLDAVASPNGGWVGLSDIAPLGQQQFLVVERDNQGGPDARIKRLYRIDLKDVVAGSTVPKTLVRDLLPDLRALGGAVVEKVEGVAVLPHGEVLVVNDNDGVDNNSGETLLLNLGPLSGLNRSNIPLPTVTPGAPSLR